MSLYLLDTNVLIDLAGEKHSSPFFEGILSEPDARLGTSILCLAEFMAGAGLKEEKFLRRWLDAGELEILCLDAVEDAFLAGDLRKKQGMLLPDALILASAIRLRAHLLTHDGILLKTAKKYISVRDPLASRP